MLDSKYQLARMTLATKLSIGLLVLLLFGIPVAVVAAIIEIESIIVSGLLLSICGLLLAALSYRPNRMLCLCFSLAPPAMSLGCFVVIASLAWGPGRAAAPITRALVVFTLVALPVGGYALRELLSGEDIGYKRPRFQFSMAALLVMMFVVSAFFGLFRAFGLVGIASGGLMLYAVVIFYTIKNLAGLLN